MKTLAVIAAGFAFWIFTVFIGPWLMGKLLGIDKWWDAAYLRHKAMR